MEEKWRKVLSVILCIVILALFLCILYSIKLAVYFALYMLPFPFMLSLYSVLFWGINLGMIITLVLCKRKVGNNRLRWVVLFSVEAVALIVANIFARWTLPVVHQGYLGPSYDYDLLYPRIGVAWYVLQLLLTLFMFLRLFGRYSPEPPEREFCGDV